MLQYVATDLLGNELGEIREVRKQHLRLARRGLSTFTGEVDIDNRGALWLSQLDKILIKIYADPVGKTKPVMVGSPVTYKKARSGENGTFEFSIASVGFRLLKRLVGRSTTTPMTNTPLCTFGSSAINLIDTGLMAFNMITALNAGDASNIFTIASDTGIRLGSRKPTVSSYVEWQYKQAMEALTELSSILDGFDWELEPTEPLLDAHGVQLALLNIAPALYEIRPECVWEYGAGRSNVEGFEDSGNAENQCDDAINLPPGFPEATDLPIEAVNEAAIAERNGMVYEDIVNADLATAELRLKLVQEHVELRGAPSRVISFTPTPVDVPEAGQPKRVPELFTDFNVGDIMPFRATEQFKTAGTENDIRLEQIKTTDILARCYFVDLEIDDSTNTAVTPLTLVSEE